MSIPEYTVRIISQSSDRDSRKRLIRYICTGSYLDGKPIPNDAWFAPLTRTRLRYKNAYIDVVECDVAVAGDINPDDIVYADFSASKAEDHGVIRESTFSHRVRHWLMESIRPIGATIWTDGVHLRGVSALYNIITVSHMPAMDSYVSMKFGVSGEPEVIWSFVVPENSGLPIRETIPREDVDARSAETPSADARSAETPSADARSAETPSADARSAETPSADARSAETPSADARSTELAEAETCKRAIMEWFQNNKSVLSRWRDDVDVRSPLENVVCSYLIVNNMPTLLAFAKRAGFEYDFNTYKQVITSDSVSGINALITDGCPCNDVPRVYRFAISYGNLEILKLLVKKFGNSESIWHHAIGCDNLDVFQWYVVNGGAIDFKEALKVAEIYGETSISAWIRKMF